MRKMFSIMALGLVIICLGAAASPLFAQEAAEASIIAPTSMWYTIWTIVQPVVALFFTTVAPVLATVVVAKLMSFLNIADDKKRLEIEEQLRKALHESAINALKFAMTKVHAPGIITGAIEKSTLNEAIKYVTEKNPETLEKLGVSPQALEDIILSKVPDIVGNFQKSLK